MIVVLQILDVLLPVIYALVAGMYLLQFMRDEDLKVAASQGLAILLGAHLLYLLARGIHFGYFPLGSKPEFFSVVALGIASTYAYIERSQKQSRTGVFFLAIAFAFQAYASVFMPYEGKHPLLLENPIYGLHVIFVVFGLTALAIGAVFAMMYLLLTRQLKRRELGMFFQRLPPLVNLERMGKLGTLVGVILLGLGLGLGYMVALAVDVPGTFDFFDIKIIITNAIWLGYVAAVLFARFRGLSGLRAAQLTIFWFIVFMTSVGVASHQFQG